MTFRFETAFQYWTVEAFLVFACGVLIALMAFGLYCCSLRQLLRAVAPASRRIQPWQVWLLFIPVLHILFMLLGADCLVRSLRAEAAGRRLEANARPVKITSIAMAAAAVLCYVPYLHLAGAFAFVVCWISHWVQIAEWCGKLDCENRVSACERTLYEHRPFNA